MAKDFDSPAMPSIKPIPEPPDPRVIPLDRQEPLTHNQVEQLRFGLGDTGPLAQAVMNANVPALAKQLATGAVQCLSTRRPADPVVGQMIFETDTKLSYFWDGTAWVTGTGSGAVLTPVGTIVPYAGTDLSTPAGWLFCAGQAVSQTTYAALFAVISTTYNTGGEGAGNFRIPDLRGRVAAGKDNMLGIAASRLTAGTSGITGTTLGAAGGNEALHSHTHTQNSHNHTQNSHSHGLTPRSAAGWDSGATQVIINGGSQYWGLRSTNNNGDGGTVSGTTGVTATNIAATATNQNTGAGASQNVQPTLVTNYIIKATADTVTGYAGTTLTGAAGGDLTGTYPNPALTTISNVPVHNSNSTLSFRTSNVERMGIDASGRVLLPYQPSFKAYAAGGGQINNPANPTYLVFGDVTTNGGYNIGSHYNTSNGIFTAPIAGRYLFSFNMLTNAAFSSNDPGYVRIDIGINNTLTHYMAHSHTNSWVMEGSAIIFSLAANDQVRMILTYGSGHYGTYSYFCGCLLS